MSPNPHARLHVLKGKLKLDDDTYRDLLNRETGKRSSKDLTPRERAKVVGAMEGMAGGSAAKGLQGPYAKKLQALWIAGWNLGQVHDRRDEAMLRWIKRQTGIDHTRFLVDAKDARKAVEGLKQMLIRAGVDWSTGKDRHWLHNDDRWRVVSAQWTRLVMADALPAPALAVFVHQTTGKWVLSELTGSDWIAVMNGLGAHVRKAAAVK